jgi:shikimate kinase
VTEGPKAGGGRGGPVRGAHLVLVGLPGAGKSTVGLLASRQLGTPFLDFDDEIERREGMSAAEIFLLRGEPYFRQLERELTADLKRKPPMVLAPGGGWMVNPANVALLRPPSRIIHLQVGVEVALDRLGSARERRPLLAGEKPAERLAALLRERAPAYGTADAAVDTQTITAQEVARFIGELATGWGWPIG